MSKLVIGNLKMNILSPLEREQYLNSFKKELGGKKFKNVQLVLCPPCVHLEAFKKDMSKKILLGAQNMFWERKGSFTGEISPAMLKNSGCEYVIIGHSERRKYFSETEEEINLKISAALKNGIKPILCVGETKTEKESNQTLEVISRQVKSALAGVSRGKTENIIVAYEPIWAVGSDMIPTSHEIMEAKVLIKKILVSLFSLKYAEKTKILYGGSVTSATVRQVCLDCLMDGALVGRESLVPYEFLKIAEMVNG